LASDGYHHGELTGRTVGLLGFGHIGRRLIELLAPFKVTAYVHDPYVPPELAEAYGVTLTSLDNVLSIPDFIVCLVPITPQTRHLLGAREFALMKPGTVFVNVSRGAVVDNAALLERLAAGTLVACLDVFDPEPIPADSPILDLANVILSPHIAGVVAEGHHRSFSFMLDELERFFAGHEPRYAILARTMANRYGKAPPAADPPATSKGEP
jgi:phosphoglycerate dehydrogenase-like enzyme